MADGKDILREWQDALQTLASTARTAAGRSELPKQLLAPMQRQLELLQEIVERERKILGRLLEPVDAIFDLLEQSSGTFRKQSEALEQASEALGETARLMKTQAELLEKTIKLMREPTELAKSAAGVDKSRRQTKAKAKKKTSS